MERLIPKVMTEVAASPDAPPEIQTAKVTNTKEGYCPVCKRAMKASVANDIDVLYCPEHTIVMPARG